MNRITTIVKPGGIQYETPLGMLHLDTLLDETTIDRMVGQMARQKLTPFDIVGCAISGNDIRFELREPLSSD